MIGKLKTALPYLLLLLFIAVAAWQTVQLTEMRKEVQDIADSVSILQEQQEALQRKAEEQGKQMDGLSENILTLQSEIDSMKFKPMDIELAPELQEHLYQACQDYNVPYTVMLAIVEHESLYIWQPPKIDANGLLSVGYTQVNYPNWAWLSDKGLDVHNERDNLTSGVVIMSKLLGKYPLEKSLVCYECGETGAIGIESTEFSRWILERSQRLMEH